MLLVDRASASGRCPPGELTLGGLLVFLAYLAQLYCAGPRRSASCRNASSPPRRAPSASSSCSTSSRASPTRRARAPLAAPAATVELRGRHLPLPAAPTRRRCAASRCASRRARSSRSSGRAARASRRSRGCCVRFADPQAGAVRLDGHDLRDVTLASLREQRRPAAAGDAAARRHRARGDRPRARRRDRRRDRGRGARGRAPTSSSRRCRTATTRGSAQRGARPLGRPAPAARDRARARARRAGADPRRADDRARRRGARRACSSRCGALLRGPHDDRRSPTTPRSWRWADRVLRAARRARSSAATRRERRPRERAVRPLGPGREIAPGYECSSTCTARTASTSTTRGASRAAAACVVKTLRPDRLRERGAARRLLREGRLLSGSRTRTSCAPTRSTTRARPAVVMETLTGADARAPDRDGAAPLRRAELANLGAHLASAICATCTARACCTSTSSRPTWSPRRGRAKLIDLSHARAARPHAAGRGTWCYMAPEQARGGTVGARGRRLGPRDRALRGRPAHRPARRPRRATSTSTTPSSTRAPPSLRAAARTPSAPR